MTDDPRKPVSVTLDIEQWQYDYAVRQAGELTDIPVASPDDPLEIAGTEKAPSWNSTEDFLTHHLFTSLADIIPQDQWPDNLKPVKAPGAGRDPEIPF